MDKKRLILVVFTLFLFCWPAFAQEEIPEPSQSPNVRYRLFRTRNVWTFLKLDTVTAKIWIVQFDISGDNRAVAVLSDRDLAKGKAQSTGRFTLYPTRNVWTFILVDQIDGNTWQVQWSFDVSKRFVIPIPNIAP